MASIWIAINEIKFILENMIDIGVDLPPFLMPFVNQIKEEVEDASKIKVCKTTNDKYF